MTDPDNRACTRFVEPAAQQHCTADCSRCASFPAPFRRVGESSYCHFTPLEVARGRELLFPADRMMRILFLLDGEFSLTHEEDEARQIAAGHTVCLSHGENYRIAAVQPCRIVVLSMILRIEFCEQDIFDDEISHDNTVTKDSTPQLPIVQPIRYLLEGLFTVGRLSDCMRYHSMKATELFMMIKVLYTPSEHAYLFQSIIEPRDNFRVFVCNNYDRVQSVGELAALANMSLSVFKRRFAEYFHDSVYHWMMRQKAMRIFSDIRNGEESTQVLMRKYGFRHYTQFSRFCKSYLQSTPAQLIASIKQLDKREEKRKSMER